MTDRGGTITITFNGEIYNYRALRGELRAGGREFSSDSDTEVLLQAYLEWDTQCLARIRGMFAFVLWDAQKQVLFGARDRAGEKPLYYSQLPGSFVFASELQALFQHPSIPRRTTVAALDHFLSDGVPPSGMSMIDGVRRLPPGHSFTYRPADDQFCLTRYWTLPPPPTRGGPVDAAALCSRLEELLSDSVAEQLHADVPIGVLLSGGVDSSIVTALAARHAPGRLRTFTVTFPEDQEYNEATFASRVAAHVGTVHTALPVAAPSDDLPAMLGRRLGEPLGDSSLLPTYLVAEVIRKEATVAIGGDGGDELFGGYHHHSLALRYERWHRMIPASLSSRIARVLESVLPIGLRGRGALLQAIGGPAGKLSYSRLMGPSLRRHLIPAFQDAYGGLTPEEDKAGFLSLNASVLQQYTRFDFHRYMTDDILVKVDRASMLHSLEVRAPLLDHRVIEFAFGEVPDALKATGTERKLLLRLLGERLLPPDLDLRRKQGFSVPLGNWLRGRWASQLEDALVSPSFGQWVNRAALRSLLRRFAGGQPLEQQLFALWMLALWKEEYRITA